MNRLAEQTIESVNPADGTVVAYFQTVTGEEFRVRLTPAHLDEMARLAREGLAECTRPPTPGAQHYGAMYYRAEVCE